MTLIFLINTDKKAKNLCLSVSSVSHFMGGSERLLIFYIRQG